MIRRYQHNNIPIINAEIHYDWFIHALILHDRQLICLVPVDEIINGGYWTQVKEEVQTNEQKEELKKQFIDIWNEIGDEGINEVLVQHGYILYQP